MVRAARLLVLAWMLWTLVLLAFVVSEKASSLSTLQPGPDSGFAFYGWTPQQIQSAIDALGVRTEVITGALLAASLFCLASFLGVGAVLLWRKSDSWVGLLGAFVLFGTGPGFSTLLLAETRTIPVWVNSINTFVAAFSWPTFFLMLYLFPNGRFAPRFTRWLAPLPYLLFGLFSLSQAREGWGLVGQWILILYALGGLASQIYRYRRVSNPTERQQTKWILFVVGLFLVILFMGQAKSLLFPAARTGSPGAFLNEFFANGILSILLPALIPLAIGISILRYRLWDIDVLIRRTLQYSLLTGLLALLYFGGTVLLQGLFSALTGQSQVPVVTVISTLGIAALFGSLRKRVQDFIDRRFYRQKYNREKVLAAFSAGLRNEVDLDRLTQSILAVVDETMQPEHLSLWFRKEKVSDQRSAVSETPPSTSVA